MTYEYYTKILEEKEKQEIKNKLNSQFGIEKINGIINKKGKERLFLFQGSFTAKEILDLERTIPIERIGIYFAKEVENELRLSIDGINIFKEQITKNIIEIPDNLIQDWMQGNEIYLETNIKGFCIIKNKQNFLGTGKSNNNRITNFIPKNRRLKQKI